MLLAPDVPLVLLAPDAPPAPGVAPPPGPAPALFAPAEPAFEPGVWPAECPPSPLQETTASAPQSGKNVLDVQRITAI
jgi:hypothetical protein